MARSKPKPEKPKPSGTEQRVEPLGVDDPEDLAPKTASEKTESAPAEKSDQEQGTPQVGRQGDQVRPICPNCSKPGEPVFCTARGGRKSAGSMYTVYYCPNGCKPGHLRQRPNFRKEIKARMAHAERQQGVGRPKD